jgi:hypothetical protein
MTGVDRGVGKGELLPYTLGVRPFFFLEGSFPALNNILKVPKFLYSNSIPKNLEIGPHKYLLQHLTIETI